MTTSVPALKFEFEYSAHELANLLPMIDPARFTELREDIRRNRHPRTHQAIRRAHP